jgi:REP element-mobilizing transposase RayT
MSKGYHIADQNAVYYLTITVQEWVDVFTRKRYRDIIIESLQYCIDNKGLSLYAYVIMSNHIHLIARAKEGFELSNIMRDFKRHTSKQILNSIQSEPESRRSWMLNIFSISENKYEFWKKDNHPFVLYSNEMIKQKLNYIHQNPVRAGLVREAQEYMYSSASNFASLDVLIKTAEM